MFIELHAQSAFSFLEGAEPPEAYAAAAARLEMPAVALCDRDGVYGAPRFTRAALNAGVKPIVGSELTLADGSRLPLLVEDREGYQNLCRLITRMKLGAAKGAAAATLDDLTPYAAGLVCLTGGARGPLARRVGAGDVEGARGVLERLVTIFGRSNCYVEIQRHLEREQERVLQGLVALARAAEVPLVATSQPLHARPEGRLLADVFTCVREKTDLDHAGRLLTVNGERRFRSGREMTRLFHDLPDALANTGELALRLGFTLKDLGYRFPEFPLPPGETPLVHLRELVARGVRARYGTGPLAARARRQVAHELDIIERREAVIQHVYQRYGRLGAGMTANVITYRGRSAAREVGKALGLPRDLQDRLARLVSNWGYQDAEDLLTKHLAEAGCDPRNPRIRHFAALWMRIQDLPRHLGQHSGGMVIAAGRLDDVVPLEPATMPGRVVAQWDKDDCAALGIIKIDLLGLGMMAVLQDSLTLVRETGREVDLAHLPPDDHAVYRSLQQADTIGVFQVESRAQMATLPRILPERFYDLVVQVSIIRPGPIVGEMVHPYIRRRRGREPVTYPHPSLEPILERTLGVPLFQEQLLRMAMTAAGFTATEAEELRRAFGFKRSERLMADVETKLRAGMARQGIHGAAAEEIVHAITAFALYGFPESHASSFALLAYASAYLKVHHPAAFYAALLNNQPMGFYHPATIVKDAQRHGLRILPVDITRSQWLCTIEPDGRGGHAVRLGLRYVRGLREAAARAIVRAREAQPFASIHDLARRAGLARSELATLAAIGALAPLGRTRRASLWEAALQDPGELFAPPRDSWSPLVEMTEGERLVADYAGTGVTLGRHPMAMRRAELRRRGVLSARELAGAENETRVRVAGSVIVRQRPGTAKGFVFLSLEDETGIANVIVTPQRFARHRLTLVTAPFLLVEGIVQQQDGVVSVRALRVEDLAPLAHNVPSHDFG